MPDCRTNEASNRENPEGWSPEHLRVAHRDHRSPHADFDQFVDALLAMMPDVEAP